MIRGWKRKAALLALVGAAAAAWLVGRGLLQHQTPDGQPPLAELSIEGFREAFNAGADRTRLVVLLSPT